MLALELLAACERAYDSPTITAHDGRDAFLYEQHDDYQVIAFRGTLTEGLVAISDWYNDFHASQVTYRGFPGKIHRGFAASHFALSNFFPDFGDKPLFITGHSKGGALAHLAAWQFADHKPVTITFGAPRVGDPEFAVTAMRLPIFRFENVHDIVPKLPVVRYMATGTRMTSPRTFTGPSSYRENHSLDTGYRPWIGA